ncbi:hypothetical protein GRX01_14060 [Halobaculum sp. WSA2]|uniref:Uncharacterized protein n=1 Tax=Halobaculum saliterrae TaxID=2073113 RepID=A0A6B0T7H3_9EURY|nr:hypothetical protein [Halobaculum saliterrae]MXR42459.1 hypothetical protein [Halobaculum saliterrae]
MDDVDRRVDSHRRGFDGAVVTHRRIGGGAFDAGRPAGRSVGLPDTDQRSTRNGGGR